MDHTIIGGQLKLGNGTSLPLSKAVRAGDFVFLSGQLALGSDGKLVGDDIAAQTEQCIVNIRDNLDLAGCDLTHVVKAAVWLVDTNDFAGFNAVYARHFSDNPPTRSTVCSGLMLRDALVEIEVVAYKVAGSYS
ncbi:MAG: RidA family protein [Gammaproteobacteria bacterium]|jgi:reactive intermediate/imine deaminase